MNRTKRRTHPKGSCGLSSGKERPIYSLCPECESDPSDFRQRVLAALNKGDDLESIHIDRDGDVFDALLGEYGTVIMSKDQLDNLVELFEADY